MDDDYPTNYYHREIASEVEIADELIFFQRSEEAMNHLKSLKETKSLFPEILFLDINMPGMDGWEFAYRCGLEFGIDSLRIIMLSTSFNPADRSRAAEHEWIHSFQSKPLTIEYLEKLREEMLGNFQEPKGLN